MVGWAFDPALSFVCTENHIPRSLSITDIESQPFICSLVVEPNPNTSLKPLIIHLSLVNSKVVIFLEDWRRICADFDGIFESHFWVLWIQCRCFHRCFSWVLSLHLLPAHWCQGTSFFVICSGFDFELFHAWIYVFIFFFIFFIYWRFWCMVLIKKWVILWNLTS